MSTASFNYRQWVNRWERTIREPEVLFCMLTIGNVSEYLLEAIRDKQQQVKKKNRKNKQQQPQKKKIEFKCEVKGKLSAYDCQDRNY
jgi:sensor histidine kinase YesM